jgi:hypothetical protein
VQVVRSWKIPGPGQRCRSHVQELPVRKDIVCTLDEFIIVRFLFGRLLFCEFGGGLQFVWRCKIPRLGHHGFSDVHKLPSGKDIVCRFNKFVKLPPRYFDLRAEHKQAHVAGSKYALSKPRRVSASRSFCSRKYQSESDGVFAECVDRSERLEQRRAVALGRWQYSVSVHCEISLGDQW